MQNSGAVLVFDDDRLCQPSTVSLLRNASPWNVLHSSSLSALDYPAHQSDPACLILDSSSWHRCAAILSCDTSKNISKAPVILTTNDNNLSFAVRAIQAGAVDVLIKPFSIDSLLSSVNFALSLDAKRHEAEKATAVDHSLFETLTPRERSVVSQITHGWLNKQVAHQLGVSVVTIKMHRGQIMKKLKVQTLPELVLLNQRVNAAADHINDLYFSRTILRNLLFTAADDLYQKEPSSTSARSKGPRLQLKSVIQ